MALLTLSSPHTHGSNRTSRIMLTVALATLPGLFALTWFFGYGTLINVILAIATALASEALVLKARKYPVSFFLKRQHGTGDRFIVRLGLTPTRPMVDYRVSHLICGSLCQTAVWRHGKQSLQPSNGGLCTGTYFIPRANDNQLGNVIPGVRH